MAVFAQAECTAGCIELNEAASHRKQYILSPFEAEK